MTDRPWTPGRWYVSKRRGVEHGSGCEVVAVYSNLAGGPPDDPSDRALVGYTTHDPACGIGDATLDAELFALAPEMAEALYAVEQGNWNCTGHCVAQIGPFNQGNCDVCEITSKLDRIKRRANDTMTGDNND